MWGERGRRRIRARRRGCHSAVAGGGAGEVVAYKLGKVAASRRGAVAGQDMREE
jgi:hypothetical protein